MFNMEKTNADYVSIYSSLVQFSFFSPALTAVSLILSFKEFLYDGLGRVLCIETRYALDGLGFEPRWE
jgi:hypothetical protein